MTPTSPLALARVTIERITAERVEIYWHVPLPDQPIPVVVTPFPVEDSVPDEKYTT